MGWQKVSACVLAFLVLVLLGMAGGLWASDGKQLMIVYTTNTEGEINPCG
jgi:hypothetical protein